MAGFEDRNAIYQTAEYAPIKFSNDVIDRMVELFSIEDLKNVEKRLYEIRHTDDPGSISRKANGRFELDFLTAQGGLAVIGFEAKANSITIIDAGRQDRLIESSVSNEELKEAAALIRSQKDPVDSGKLIQEIEKLTKGNSELIQEVDKLKKNEENLSPSVKTKCTNTHDKIVIVDDKKFMIGSANVFSFSGETAGSEVHDEIMMTSGDRAKINELKEMFFGWE